MDRITSKDLARALEGHVTALEKCGIKYDGRLILSEGSKTYGNAYRLNLTDFPNHCQNRQWDEQSASYAKIVWDHTDCERCHGTKIEKCSGHSRPPVGDDYLGMTAREAYDALTARTRSIYDVATALDRGKS